MPAALRKALDGAKSEVGGDAVTVHPALLRFLGGKGHYDDERNEGENESRSRKCHQIFPRFLIVPTICELSLIEAEWHLSNCCQKAENHRRQHW